MKKITKKERQLQKALGTLRRYFVDLVLPYKAYAHTSVTIEATSEREAMKRAETLVKEKKTCDDCGNPIEWVDGDSGSFVPSKPFLDEVEADDVSTEWGD